MSSIQSECQRITLDIDLNPKYGKDKYYVETILAKIHHCQDCQMTKCRPSHSKGYHIEVHCTKDCDMCRMVFDDQTRFAKDSMRPKYAQNVLFQRKNISADNAYKPPTPNSNTGEIVWTRQKQ